MIQTADMDYSDDDPAYVRFIGVMMIVLFGGGFCLLLRAFRYWRRGLVVNADGVTYNAGIDGVGLVAWRDITGIEPLDTPRMDFIRISLKDPAKYVQRSNPVMRPLAWLNWKFYGSPIHMSAFFLAVDRDTLLAELRQYHQRFGGGRPRRLSHEMRRQSEQAGKDQV